MSDKIINEIIKTEAEAKKRIEEAKALNNKIQRSNINKRKEEIKEEIKEYKSKKDKELNKYELKLKDEYSYDILEEDYNKLVSQMVNIIIKGNSCG